MADRPIGTIFVELDLDASRYTKGQQKLLKDAQSTTLNIEQNFKNLGIKSSAEMDLMRAKIINSFNAIANSSKATANDIMRAEEAKNAKLKELTEKQFGAQTSAIDSIKKHWIASSVAIYAAFKAIGQAVEMVKAGAMVEKQSAAFNNLAVAAGTSSERIMKSLKDVSGGLVAEADLMAAAGKAMLMNIPADKITELMKVAAATSRMTGQTITQAFSDINLGVARQSRLILDNLGIIVDVDKANQDYAKTLGKTAESLSEAEKQQSFMNAVMKSGQEMIGRLGSEQGSLDGINKLLVAQKNLWDEISRIVAKTADGPLVSFSSLVDGITAKLKKFVEESNSENMLEQYRRIENLRARERLGQVPSGSTAEALLAANRRWVGRNEAEIAAELAMKNWKAPDSYAAWREREGNYAANTAEENKRILEAFENNRKRAEDEAKKSLEINKSFWEDYRKETSSAMEFEKFKLDEQYKEYQKYVTDKNALNAWYFRETMKLQQKSMLEEAGRMVEPRSEAAARSNLDARIRAEKKSADEIQKQREAMAKADQELSESNWWKTYIEDTEDATRANEIFTDSMNIMSQSAADAFAEFVTGTKSAKDAFTQMVQSMIAALTRLSTQRAFEEFAGMLLSAGQSMFSGWAGGGSIPSGMGTNTSFAGGGTMGGYMAIVKHSGGIASEAGPSRRVPAMVFANAPRYHDGLAPEEVPAILKRGEGVFTPEQMKAMGSRSLSISVPVRIDSTGEQERDRRLSARMRDEVEETARRVLRDEMR